LPGGAEQESGTGLDLVRAPWLHNTCQRIRRRVCQDYPSASLLKRISQRAYCLLVRGVWNSGKRECQQEWQLLMHRPLDPERYARVERVSLMVSKLFLVIWDSVVLGLCLERRISLAYGGVFMWLLLLLGFAPYLLIHNLYVRGFLKNR
jgi:hypothetical protein